MRKIEQDMVNAVKTQREWKKDNTEVRVTVNGGSEVYLFNNHIGTYCNGHFQPNIETLRRWPTVTTRSRLRAFGVDVCQHNHQTFIDGERI